MSAHPSDPATTDNPPPATAAAPMNTPTNAPGRQFWTRVSQAPAPVVGIINQREQWPWDVVLDRSRPLPAALEWRLDSIFGPDQSNAKPPPDPETLAPPPVPLLLTARHPDEGGEYQLGAADRCSLLLHFMPLANAVDIELRAMADMQPVVTAARELGVAVVVSSHDFQGTPSEQQLRDTVQQATEGGADAVKIATRTDDTASLLRLLSLLAARHPDDIPLIVMGMGRLGRASRLAAVACGSPLAYGHLGHANISGQWHAVELAEALIRQSCSSS